MSYARVSERDSVWKFARPMGLDNYRQYGEIGANLDVRNLQRDYTSLKEDYIELGRELEKAQNLNTEYRVRVLELQEKIAKDTFKVKKHNLVIDAYKSAVSLLDKDEVRCRNDECVICSYPLKNKKDWDQTKLYVCLLCRNATHLKCIEEWWKVANIDKTCPYCKGPDVEIT
jgi:hypothetical protein